MSDLERLAQTPRFIEARQSERAEQIVWLLHRKGPHKTGVSIADVCNVFAELDLVEPNVTRLRDYFRKSKNVRSLSGGRFSPTRDFSLVVERLLPVQHAVPEEVFDVASIDLPPFVPPDRKEDLAKMVRAYAHLFLLENSMRGLIESVLRKKMGADWWEQAGNAGMKKKHANRVQNEELKKWAPARSDFGPLYALDWTDLISIIRKYQEHFASHIKDINFLHRYEDSGVYRNIVAHNGVLRESDDFELIRIYYRDWIKQLS